MKRLIEFKLHAGQFPYFVEDILNGVEIDGKRYGISHDDADCYLPDTVKQFEQQEFIDTVTKADILTIDEDGKTTRIMTDKEKEEFCKRWLDTIGRLRT